MAMTLSAHRNGRAAMLPQNICSSEKGPSKVSFIRKSDGNSIMVSGRTQIRVSKTRAESLRKYFCSVKFSTQVLISMWKSAPSLGLTTPFSVS